MALYFLDARPVEAPLPPSAVLREPQLGRAKPPSRQEVGGVFGVGRDAELGWVSLANANSLDVADDRA